MSQAVYPVLPGLTYGVIKSPTFSTRVQTAVSGKELRAAFWATPIWYYTLVYEFLRNTAAFNELQTLLGFFNARQGKFDSFLLSDPDDNAVTAQLFGTGDGATTAFQLARSYGGFLEPVKDLNGTAAIYNAGVLQVVTTNYTISATGLVTFVTAPASGHALTWTGSYYWRCRFDLDSVDFNKFMATFWEVKQVNLVSLHV